MITREVLHADGSKVVETTRIRKENNVEEEEVMEAVNV